MKSCVVYAASDDVEEIRNALHTLGFEVTFLASDPLASGTPPLSGVIAPDAMDGAVRSYLLRNNFITADDLTRLDLNTLASADGISRDSLIRFVRALARSERYPDTEALQTFLVRRGIFI